MYSLESSTFESGSKLREIRGDAFLSCGLLESIFLPASLSAITASVFTRSSIEEVRVDDANPHYFVSGRFLIKVDGMTLIRCFGSGKDLKADCLSDLGLKQIGRYAFSRCSALKSIFLPASIEILHKECFSRCSSLSQIIFESGSRLTQMGFQAFARCSSLTSICIPANVETIPEECFASCTRVVAVSFEPGSKLARIDFRAFLDWYRLRSLVIPAQLEIMACGVFRGCRSLSELIFDLPSRLKQLDLPPSEFGSLYIPDCVEVVFGGIAKRQGQRRLLHFGRESCLITIELWHIEDTSTTTDDCVTQSDSFVHLSERALRRLRPTFEALK
jgi:hypothetical protein